MLGSSKVPMLQAKSPMYTTTRLARSYPYRSTSSAYNPFHQWHWDLHTSEYRFHNCVWLVLNDAIIGVAFGSFLCENSDVLARMSEDFLQVCPISLMSKD